MKFLERIARAATRALERARDAVSSIRALSSNWALVRASRRAPERVRVSERCTGERPRAVFDSLADALEYAEEIPVPTTVARIDSSDPVAVSYDAQEDAEMAYGVYVDYETE